MAVNASV
jgi:hypothetical protein